MLSLPKHLYRTANQIRAVRPGYFGRLFLLILLGTCGQLAFAQQHTPRVYTYVEQMPQLPGGGGQQAIANEILKRLRIPVYNLEEQVPDRIRFSFVVNTDGALQDIKIVNSSHSAALDKAIVDAVQALPRFTPGYQDGRPVRVQLTFPLTLCFR